MAQTSVLNNEDAGRFYGWIPPHGRFLADGEEHIVEGDLRTILAGGGVGGRHSRGRELAGLNQDVLEGNVTVTELPDPQGSSASA